MNNSAVDNTENVSLIRLLEVLWKDKLIILVTSLCAALIAIYVSIFILPKALRVHKVKTLYDKDKIVYNFVNMDKIFPSRNP